jgi:hypothetical protein
MAQRKALMASSRVKLRRHASTTVRLGVSSENGKYRT